MPMHIFQHHMQLAHEARRDLSSPPRNAILTTVGNGAI